MYELIEMPDRIARLTEQECRERLALVYLALVAENDDHPLGYVFDPSRSLAACSGADFIEVCGTVLGVTPDEYKTGSLIPGDYIDGTESPASTQPERVIVNVTGGIADVDPGTVPPDVVVEVRDYDVQGKPPETHQTDDDGEACAVSRYEHVGPNEIAQHKPAQVVVDVDVVDGVAEVMVQPLPPGVGVDIRYLDTEPFDDEPDRITEDENGRKCVVVKHGTD